MCNHLQEHAFVSQTKQRLSKKHALSNAFKILEQPTGGVPKNTCPVNLVKIVESLGKY